MSGTRNELLRKEREKRGWSQARVAAQIDTDPGNVSRWERGHSVPSPYFRERLCALFGQSAVELGFLPDGPSESIDSASSDTAAPDEIRRAESAVGMQEPQIRLLAALSYLLGWVSGLFLYLLSRERFVRFHALQALCFFGAVNAISVVLIMLLILVKQVSSSPPNAPEALASLVLIASLFLLNLFAAIAWIVVVFQAWKGQYYQLPLVSRIVRQTR